MFRIRKLLDPYAGANPDTLREVVALMRAQFLRAPAEEFEYLSKRLVDPLKSRFLTELFVAEDATGRVRGAAVVLYAPDLHFLYLDYLAVQPGRGGRGVGSAIYQRIREEVPRLGAVGLFYECLPDDPALCRDPAICRENADRLRFYERFGARPIAGTHYETPLTQGGDNPPFLVYDQGDGGRPLRRSEARKIVTAILERKYAKLCPPGYISDVVASFRDDPVRLRPLRYTRPSAQGVRWRPREIGGERIPLIVNEGHEIHHVRERGYVQAPVRIPAILRDLMTAAPFHRLPAADFGEQHIRAVHDGSFVDYLKRACAQVPSGRSIYPYIFPIRNTKRPPKDLPLRAGYFCIDAFTPLNANAWHAARQAVNCTLTAANGVLAGSRFAYSLVRPPGHHAERRAFGGFCYFNNAAIAAHYLSSFGKVAVLDIDYHHGNGTQDIFWRRSDVFTLSLHGHPSFAYPYFSGFADEVGEGEGRGFNVNYPLPETLAPAVYLQTLNTALRRVARFRPNYLVVPLGYDTGLGDPTGSWSHRPKDFHEIGRRIAGLGIPTLIVQEGGYRTRTLGANAHGFFAGLWSGRVSVLPNSRRRGTQFAPAGTASSIAS